MSESDLADNCGSNMNLQFTTLVKEKIASVMSVVESATSVLLLLLKTCFKLNNSSTSSLHFVNF